MSIFDGLRKLKAAQAAAPTSLIAPALAPRLLTDLSPLENGKPNGIIPHPVAKGVSSLVCVVDYNAKHGNPEEATYALEGQAYATMADVKAASQQYPHNGKTYQKIIEEMAYIYATKHDKKRMANTRSIPKTHFHALMNGGPTSA